MQNKIILHIPHSSLKLTSEFKKIKKYLDKNELLNFNKTITDLYTDKLFSSKKFCTIKAKHSRICYDVERFDDDSKEEMSQYGMGVIYNKTNIGKEFIKVCPSYKNKILYKYYYPYHSYLDKIVNRYLKNKKVILIDCHSFSREIIMNGNIENLPDFCIGTNKTTIYEERLNKIVVKFLTNLGYNVLINYPYVGAMTPNSLVDNPNENLTSIMIEVNKELYMNKFNKSKNFITIKKHLFKLLKLLEKTKL